MRFVTVPALVAPPYREIKSAASGTPRVSVLVPTYNTRAHVREAVCSLLNQTWRDLEIVVVDDASTDGSTEVLADIDDPRLRIVRLDHNVGLSGARNAAIALSRGEYIGLLDADDIALPHRIETQVRVLDARPRIGLVACLVNRIDVHGNILSRVSNDWIVSDRALAPLLLFMNPLACMYLLRRSVIPAHGFRPLFAEDYAMAVDVAERHEIALVRQPLVNYRVRPNSIMRTKHDQVAKDTLSTQRRALARLGLQDSACDAGLMRSVMNLGITPGRDMTSDWLHRVRAFLDLVQRANRSTRLYDIEALAEAICYVWELALLEAARRGSLRLNWLSPGTLLTGLSLPGMLLRTRTIAHAVVNLSGVRTRARRNQ